MYSDGQTAQLINSVAMYLIQKMIFGFENFVENLASSIITLKSD